MKIRILTVGKPETKSYAQLCDLYLKRIAKYAPVSLESVKPEKIKSKSDQEIISDESERLLEKLETNEYVIVLDKAGKTMSSENFARLFNKLAQQSVKRVTFVIGGPLGFDDSIRQRADRLLSFSPMTFPHELALTMLLEQIYRAQTILRGGKYHK